jgi:dTDP-4-amino-4,6-dideoxygalactose transaminase
MYTVLVDEGAYGMGSRGLLHKLAGAGIQARPLWQPIHASPAYAGLPPASCPVATRLYETALSLPCSVGLSDAQMEKVVDAIRG